MAGIVSQLGNLGRTVFACPREQDHAVTTSADGVPLLLLAPLSLRGKAQFFLTHVKVAWDSAAVRSH